MERYNATVHSGREKGETGRGGSRLGDELAGGLSVHLLPAFFLQVFLLLLLIPLYVCTSELSDFRHTASRSSVYRASYPVRQFRFHVLAFAKSSADLCENVLVFCTVHGSI